MNFLLSVEPENYSEPIINTMGGWETFLFGGKMLLIGMGTVFAVLCILWFCLYLFKVIFHDMPGKNTTSDDTPAVVESATPVVTQSYNDEEVIVAIAAAIAMAESESTGAKFKVVSFKRN